MERQAKAKILFVDDDPDMRDLVGLILRTQDYEITTAKDGEDCLNQLSHEIPDLLILNLLMPRVDGFAVCRALAQEDRERIRNMPVLLLTSVGEWASSQRYELETGNVIPVRGYLLKPFDPGDLILTVRRILSEGGVMSVSG